MGVRTMAKVLVADDEQSMREFLEYLLDKEGLAVRTVTDGREALDILRDDPDFDLVISDLKMEDVDGLQLLQQVRELDADLPFIFVTAYASSDTAIEALKLGAYDYVTKPFQVEELRNLIRNALQTSTLKRQIKMLESERAQNSRLVGVSAPMLEIYKLIGTVATSDSTVLIFGESGTGKELVANAIHESGRRKKGAFVSINCGAFTETLLESELFGYMKGSFTGAGENKKGLFETADGGTLFLDEVGEMSPAMQVKLLRALQERKIRRVGGTVEIPVDVRLIAATNRDLETEIENGGFREDLYYRLAVIPIQVPSLRQRRADIVTLVRHFIQLYNKKLGKKISGISEEALSCLEQYHWPGNVRELENVIERALTLENAEFIQKDRLPEKVRNQTAPMPTRPPELDAEAGIELENYLDEVERQFLVRALELGGGNQKKAAEILKLSYRSYRHRMERLGVPKKLSP